MPDARSPESNGHGRSSLYSLVVGGLGGAAVRRSIRRDELLFHEGDAAAGLWALEEGLVRLYAADAEGREQTIHVIGPGQTFNAVPFLDRGREPVTARVVKDGRVLVVAQALMDRVMTENPVFAVAVAQEYARRLRQTVALVNDLSFRSVTGRVALVLLQSIEPRDGVGAGSGGRPLTQREIAELVGTSREVVARSLRKLEEEGLIATPGRSIVLLDRERLASYP
jgi:CRP/FNR family transcriptional regulator, cyclic AMP receptor protein